MSQKERDAFMSGFLWRVFLDGAPGCDNEARAKAEAARRYPDAPQPETGILLPDFNNPICPDPSAHKTWKPEAAPGLPPILDRPIPPKEPMEAAPVAVRHSPYCNSLAGGPCDCAASAPVAKTRRFRCKLHHDRLSPYWFAGHTTDGENCNAGSEPIEEVSEG